MQCGYGGIAIDDASDNGSVNLWDPLTKAVNAIFNEGIGLLIVNKVALRHYIRMIYKANASNLSTTYALAARKHTSYLT